jgi:hypothetical protein
MLESNDKEEEEARRVLENTQGIMDHMEARLK